MEQASFNFIAAVTICSDFGAKENSLSLFPLFPHLFAMKWWDQMPWSSSFECWLLSFNIKTTLLFHLHQEALFSSSSLSIIRVVLSEYLRLLIFLPEILIPACVSCSLTFWMKYSIYKLIEQDDNNSLDTLLSQIEPVRCSNSCSNCCFLTYIQISQEAGQVVWYS